MGPYTRVTCLGRAGPIVHRPRVHSHRAWSGYKLQNLHLSAPGDDESVRN